MKYIIYIVLVGTIVGVTFGFFQTWGWNGFVPDLILLIVLALSLVFDNLDYLFFAFLGGFWLDIMFALPIGSFIIPLVICGVISSQFIRKWLFADIRWYHFVAAIIGATLILKLWLWGYTNLFYIFDWYNFSISGKQILNNLIFNILANVILAYPVYTIVEMLANSQLRWQKNKLQL